MWQSVAASGPLEASLPWAAALGLTLSFYADGLSVFFAVLIAGIGALIVLYSSRYLDGHPAAGRFHATLFAFMGAMLGVVLANNMLTLFVFWELTGFTSFLLIGFEHERQERAAAVQALIVTGTGGMALLAAAVLVEQAAGTLICRCCCRWPVASLIGTYAAIVALVLLAAFTKSAQVPFHFWLPNAMTAPTPVSAYLHSATMVKAGHISRREDDTDPRRDAHRGRQRSPSSARSPWSSGASTALAETDLKRILGILDRERAWRADDAARRRRQRPCRRAGVPGRACVLQGRAVPGGGHDRPRDGQRDDVTVPGRDCGARCRSRSCRRAAARWPGCR